MTDSFFFIQNFEWSSSYASFYFLKMMMTICPNARMIPTTCSTSIITIINHSIIWYNMTHNSTNTYNKTNTNKQVSCPTSHTGEVWRAMASLREACSWPGGPSLSLSWSSGPLQDHSCGKRLIKSSTVPKKNKRVHIYVIIFTHMALCWTIIGQKCMGYVDDLSQWVEEPDQITK